MLNDLIQKYRLIPLWGRILVCVVLGLMPGVYLYFMDLGEKELALEEAQKARDESYRKLQIDDKKVKNIKDLEEQKRFTEQQLKKAKQFLPETYDMEAILQKTAALAKETGIEFKLFEPKRETLIEAVFPYYEMKIGLSLAGTYQQIATYFDRIVNIEPSIYIKSVEFNRDFTGVKMDTGAKNPSIYDRAIAVRRDQKLTAKTEIAVYRSATDDIAKQVENKIKNQQKPAAAIRADKGEG